VSGVLVSAVVSKVPFFVAGGALAGWAVVLAALGLSRPDFPARPGSARTVMAISVVLMAVAIAMSIHTSTFE
jgi:hypothetical protein